MLKYSAYNVHFDDLETNEFVSYNTSSGKFIVFTGEAIKPIKKYFRTNKIPLGPVRNDLIEYGMVIDSDVDEIDIIEKRNQEWVDSGKVVLTISLTQSCNFDCPYCFEPHLKKTVMDETVRARLLDYIESLLPHKSELVIDWYGGEPLLRFDLLCKFDKEIASMCQTYNVTYLSSVSTNGALLNREKAERIVSETSIRSARICIDGPPEIHNKYRPFTGGYGSFEIIWENLISSVDVLQINIRVNVDKGNAGSLDTLLAMVEESPLNHQNMTVVIKPIISSRLRPRDNAYTPAEWANVGPKLKQRVLDRGLKLGGVSEKSCAHCVVFSQDQFMVDHNGFLYKCSDTFEAEDAVGRLLDGGKVEVDQSKVDPWTVFPTHYDDECRTCSALPLCMGGCTFRRLAFSSNWCGSERYNLEGHAKLRYRTARASNSADVITVRNESSYINS